MTRSATLAFSIIFVALFIRAALGQPATGSYPFGTFSSGTFDTVNNGNLNVHFEIPVVNKTGRQLPFYYSLSYDSLVWFPVSNGMATTWTPVNTSTWGWRAVTEAETGYISYADLPQKCSGGTNWHIYNNWVYHDPFGVPHLFPSVSVSTYSSVCNPNPTVSAQGNATDGSGYTIYVTNAPTASLTGRFGGAIAPPVQSGTGNGQVFDRNGNYVSMAANTFTDTLGTSVLTVSGNGNPASPTLLSWTNPGGGTSSVTLNYTTYTVQTAFGCGFNDYGPMAWDLISSISMPDGTQYTITYEPTPGSSGNTTGRIKTITLPTGGTITYSYSGGNQGIICTDGTTATLTRATPDGTWTYAHAEPGPGGKWTTTITDPKSNQTVMYFQAPSVLAGTPQTVYETERQVNQLISGNQTLLEQIDTCYNQASSPCTGAAIALPIKQVSAITSLPAGGSSYLKSQVISTYDGTYGVLTETDGYDWASNAPGSKIKSTQITYATKSQQVSTLNMGSFEVPQSISVYQGTSTTPFAQTSYGYDQFSVTASGAPQLASVTGSRGNATTVSQLVSGSTFLNQTFHYYDDGNVATSTDVNNATTTYTYGQCGNNVSLLTSVSLPLSLSRSQTWNCNGGVITQITDENSNAVTFTFNDPYYWRPTAITDPTNYTTNINYYHTASICGTQPQFLSCAESTLNFNGTISTTDIRTTLDPLGRVQITQREQAQGSTTYDSVETDYDSLGRPYKVSVPYSAPAGSLNTNGAATTITTYDALGRPLTVTDGSGGSVTYNYNQNDILVQFSPTPSGEQPKSRQYEYNALGQLTSVCELASGLGGTCGQNITQTGAWTQYTYDALGDLTSVAAFGGKSSPVQTRTYTYDGLGRMTSEINPETAGAAHNYTFDTDATCGNSNGDMVKRTDPIGNTVCYGYDALHRVTSITYTGPSDTGNKFYVYDSATVNGNVMHNAKGRLAEAYTNSTKSTDLGFSYSTRGEVTDTYQSSPNSGGYYHINAIYWPNGLLNQMSSNLPIFPSFTQTPDGEGRPNSITAGSNQVVTSTTYNTFGEPTMVNFGSGVTDSYKYDSGTGRMTYFQSALNSGTFYGILGWNANGTLASLTIGDPFNSTDSQSCSYAYDQWFRMEGPQCGSVWSQTMSYDAFGNISTSGTVSFMPTYNQATNRYVTIPSGTLSYDANGQLTSDGFHTYEWNADGNLGSLDGTIVSVYDALGRRVEQVPSSGATTQIVWDPLGWRRATMSVQSFTRGFIQLPGQSLAFYNSSGFNAIRHADWLGSTRLATAPNGTYLGSVAVSPYGYEYASGGSSQMNFTNQRVLLANDLWDFPARELHPTQGRLLTPDKAGLAAVDITDPQTWNRYAYVRDTPTSLTDPSGLQQGDAGGIACFDPVYADTHAQCQGPGSPWCMIHPGDETCIGGGLPVGDGGEGGGGGGGGGPVVPAPAGIPPPISGFPNGETLGVPTGLRIPPPTLGGVLGFPDPGFECDFGLCSGAGLADGFAADPSEQIDSWWEQIQIHLEKIAQYPDSPAVPHWWADIRALANSILAKATKVTLKRRPGALDKYLQRVIQVSVKDLENLLKTPIIILDPCLQNPNVPFCRSQLPPGVPPA